MSMFKAVFYYYIMFWMPGSNISGSVREGSSARHGAQALAAAQETMFSGIDHWMEYRWYCRLSAFKKLLDSPQLEFLYYSTTHVGMFGRTEPLWCVVVLLKPLFLSSVRYVTAFCHIYVTPPELYECSGRCLFKYVLRVYQLRPHIILAYWCLSTTFTGGKLSLARVYLQSTRFWTYCHIKLIKQLGHHGQYIYFVHSELFLPKKKIWQRRAFSYSYIFFIAKETSPRVRLIRRIIDCFFWGH